MKPRKRFSQLLHTRNQLRLTTFRGAPGYENVGTTVVGPAIDQLRSFKQIDDYVDTPNMNLVGISINPVSLYSFETGKCEIDLTCGPYPTWFSGGKEVYTGDISPYLTSVDSGWSTFGTADLQAMRDIILIKAYAKIKDDVLMGGEFMGTIGSTVGMLRKPLSSVQDLTKKLVKVARNHWAGKKRFTAPNSKQWREALSNAYLEQRYGWAPLYKDVAMTFKTVKSDFLKFEKGIRVARAGQKLDFKKESAFDIPIYGSVRAKGTSLVVTKLKVDAGVIWSRLPMTTEQKAMEFLSMNYTDLGTTAWELTPFSFCADWVTNIGDWLNAISLPPSIVIEGSWVTTTEKRNNTLTGKCYASWSGVNNETSTIYERANSRYDRLANPVLASRPTYTGLPNMSQAAAGLALLASGSLKSLLHY